MIRKVLIGIAASTPFIAPIITHAETLFVVPTSTASQALAYVTGTLGDAGFLTVLVVAAGIPLVFYVAKQLIGLIPKARGRR